MQANQIAGVLIPSRVFDQQHPGHMAVKFLAPDGEPAVRGFRFTPDELPEEYQPAEKWREFFKREDGRVPGYIMDEFAFEQRCTHYSGQVITRSWTSPRFVGAGNGLQGFGVGAVVFVVDELLLQGGEERFHRRVVPAVALAAH